MSRASFTNEIATRILRSRAAQLSVAWVVILTLSAIVVPWWLAEAGAPSFGTGATAPSAGHPFGTDMLGRDYFIRILDGARISLLVGAVATAVSVLIGVPYGAIAGFRGGVADQVMMRIVDILYGLPSVLFVLLLLAWFGRDPSLGMILLFAGLGAISWLTTARMVRAQILSLREREFVAAARLAGTSGSGILFRHLVPHTTGTVLAFATLTIPRVMVEEAFLSFLGLGVGAPRASWGTLLSDGMQSFREHPWLVGFPGVFLAVTLAAFYCIGDALHAALDPSDGREGSA